MPRVLLVDDMEDNLVALEAILRPLHLELIRARSGEEALKALLRDEYAMVLLDVIMPGMDGFETASHIRRLDQTKDIPIIFLTADNSSPAYAFRGYATGAADFLTKPFDPWVLRAKVEVFADLYEKTQLLAARTPRQLVPLEELSQRLSALEDAMRQLGGFPAAESSAQLGEMADQVKQLHAMLTGLADDGEGG